MKPLFFILALALALCLAVLVQAALNINDVPAVESKIKQVIPEAILILTRDEATNKVVSQKLSEGVDPGADAEKNMPVESSPKLEIEVPATSDPKARLEALVKAVEEAVKGTSIKLDDVRVELEFPGEIDAPVPARSQVFLSAREELGTFHSRKRLSRMVNGAYFTNAHKGVGGIQIHEIGNAGHGTLGGFIYPRDNKAKLFAVTNHHVCPNAGTNVESPTFSGTIIGKVKAAAYQADPHYDVSFIELPDAKINFTRCAVRGLGDVTGVHAYGKIAANAKAPAGAIGQSVQRSGMRTGVSVGRISAINYVLPVNVGGAIQNVRYHYKMRATGLPLFQQVPHDHNYGRVQDAPSKIWHDNNEPLAVKNAFINFIVGRFGHTNAEATALVNAMGTKGLLTMFGLQGDSGSFVMVHTEVLGHFDANSWVPEFLLGGTATAEPAGCVNHKCVYDAKLGRWWGGLHLDGHAMSIQASLDQINVLHGGQNYEICIQARRP